MNFYRLKHNTTLHSFGDDIGEVPILLSTLSDCQSSYVKLVGGHLIDIESETEINTKQPYFVFTDDFYFSLPFLKNCVSTAKSCQTNLQFCVDNNEFNERYVLPHKNDSETHHVFDFYYKVNDGKIELKSIEQSYFKHYNILPTQMIEGKRYSMHQSDNFAGHIISPFHLLYLNLAANLGRTYATQKKIPNFIKKRFGNPTSKWFYRGLKRMNKIGKNCQIHPSAIIEGSTIGDNAKIGANAIVRLSVLGDDCYISDNVTCINSVLRDRSFIANSNYINCVLCYEEVFVIHGPYHLSVFGKNSACFAVINCDIRLDAQTIKIPTSQGIIDSKQHFLGIAYGHHSKTGGGNIIAAGRIVPNHKYINPPNHIILKIDE
jgi:NDP-sugar pyrophosphorylase family protein